MAATPLRPYLSGETARPATLRAITTMTRPDLCTRCQQPRMNRSQAALGAWGQSLAAASQCRPVKRVERGGIPHPRPRPRCSSILPLSKCCECKHQCIIRLIARHGLVVCKRSYKWALCCINYTVHSTAVDYQHSQLLDISHQALTYKKVSCSFKQICIYLL